MKTQVTKISILQTSKVMALVSPVFGLVHCGIGVICTIIAVVLIANERVEEGVGLLIPGVILLFMPVLLFFMTFIFTAMGSLLYNWVASKAGGIEFETAVIEPALSETALADPETDRLA